MIIHINQAYQAELLDVHDFRKFNVEASLLMAHRVISNRPAGLFETFDENTAWISIQALKEWPGLSADEDWQSSFSEMIAKAARHGWVDIEKNLVKAHVVWK